MSDAPVWAPLRGIRVLECADGVAPAVAAMCLADAGAEVLKVVWPGDPASARRGSACWDRNKRLVPATSPDLDAARLSLLARNSDVCITRHALVPGTDLTARRLRSDNPRGIALVMPVDGAPGPQPPEANEIIAARMGLALYQCSVDGGPVETVSPFLLYFHGLWAAAAAVAALIERVSSGAGQIVAVSGSQAALVAGAAPMVINPGSPAGSRALGPGGPNPCYTRYRCADGTWIFFAALTERFQRRGLHALGLAWVLEDPRIAGDAENLLLPANREWLRGALADRFAARDRDSWLRALEEADCPAGPLLERDGWLEHPQVRAMDMAVEVDDPEHGTVTMPGVPIRPEGARPDLRGRRWLGAGSGGAIAWQSLPPEPPAAPGAGPAADKHRSPQGPLAGYRVIDLGTILAGPYAGSLLAQLGAEVVKVEPVTGDPFRARGFMYNRGLRSLAVDLRDRRGLDAFRKLAASSDVVIDNFRNGVAARLGVDRAHLRDVHPELVTVSISGFGDRGPLAEAPGFDPILQGMSGMMRAQGGTGEPVFVTTPVNDVGAAVCGALAACLGLFDRLTSGRGGSLRTSLLSLATLLQADEVVTWAGCGPGPIGGPDFAGRSPLRRYYRAADGWIRLEAEPSGREDLEQLAVGSAPRGPGLSDAELQRRLAARLGSLQRDDATTLLGGPGRAAVAVRAVEELVDDGGHLDLHRPDAGSPFTTAGRLAGLDRTQEQGPFLAPGLGEHSRAVLASAGMAPGEIDALVQAGVVAEGPPMVLGDFAAYR